MLEYLSRYTHRVAISNSRLVAFDEHGITFRYKNYRTKNQVQFKSMTYNPPSSFRRFLIHTLPKGFMQSPWLCGTVLSHLTGPRR